MVGIKLTRGNTGRSHSWQTENFDDVGNQVHRLTDLIDREYESGRFRTPAEAAEHLYMAAKGLEAVLAELKAIEPVDLEGTLYRTRPFDRNNPPDDFGPPRGQRANRFNVQGEIAWYVARTDKALIEELSQTNSDSSYWVQKFSVDPQGLKLLPLAPVQCADYPALNQFMLMAERKVNDIHSPAHIGTQLLRNLCEQAGFEAIEYPTVTGLYASDSTACNVAIFSEEVIKRCLKAKVGQPYRIGEGNNF